MPISTSRLGADPADQPDRQQRMAAELEEVVVDADPLDASTSANRPHRISSCGVRGARRACDRQRFGRRQRAAVELAVRRSAAACRARRSPAAPCSRAALPEMLAQLGRRTLWPPAPRRRPAACARARPRARSRRPAPRCPAAAAPPRSRRARCGSPRSLTWSSARPRNSSTPSARQRARSPVRYIRLAGVAVRVGDEPLRRQRRPVQIAARQPDAGDVELAGNARRHRLQVVVQHIGPIVRASAGRSGLLWPLVFVADPWEMASMVVSVGP